MFAVAPNHSPPPYCSNTVSYNVENNVPLGGNMQSDITVITWADYLIVHWHFAC